MYFIPSACYHTDLYSPIYFWNSEFGLVYAVTSMQIIVNLPFPISNIPIIVHFIVFPIMGDGDFYFHVSWLEFWHVSTHLWSIVYFTVHEFDIPDTVFPIPTIPLPFLSSYYRVDLQVRLLPPNLHIIGMFLCHPTNSPPVHLSSLSSLHLVGWICGLVC